MGYKNFASRGRSFALPHSKIDTQTFLALLIGMSMLIFSVSSTALAASNDLSNFDRCIQEKGGAAVIECRLQIEAASQVQNTGDIAVKEDSTNQTSSSTDFRFAGTGLLTEQVGDAYDVGIGEYDWRGDNNCLKFEATIKKAQFKREDGVMSEMPILDEDGNTIAGQEKSHGDGCDSNLDFEVTGHNRGASTANGGKSEQSCSYYELSGDGGSFLRCVRTQYGTAYSYTYVKVRKTIVRDGQVLGVPEDRTCTLTSSSRYSSYAEKKDNNTGGQFRRFTGYRSPSYPSYPVLSDSAKGTCATQFGWNFDAY